MPPPNPSSPPAAQLANPLALNTAVLNPGTGICGRLSAIAAAGFGQAGMWREDLYAHGGQLPAVQRTLAACQLGLANLQVIRDLPGTRGPLGREVRQIEALGMLTDAAALGAPLILVTSSTDEDADPSLAAGDLAWLADQASTWTVNGEPVRVAYGALPWGTGHARLVDAWAAVQKADRGNLGVAIDSFHLFATGGVVADTDLIDPARIFLLQLADLADTPATTGATKRAAQHQRLLPGDGKFPLAQLTGRLLERGYTGPISVDVFSDGLAAQPAGMTACAAMAAMKQLLADVAGFSQPLPPR